MKRNVAYGIKPVRIGARCCRVYGAPHFEGVHPQQCGYLRLQGPHAAPARTAARAGSPFHPRYAAETARQILRASLRYGLKLHRMRKRLEKDPAHQALSRSCHHARRRRRDRDARNVRAERRLARRRREGAPAGAGPAASRPCRACTATAGRRNELTPTAIATLERDATRSHRARALSLCFGA